MSTGESKNLVFGEAFDYCFAQLNSKIEATGIVINTKNITTVIKLAMEIVEASALKGDDQKKLVEKIVRKIVVDAPITDEKEFLLLNMIDEGIVGDVIDLVISASKGELNVNVVEKAAVGCCLAVLKNRQQQNK
tara:strand:+ start:545 stop:946 length:402 start_codon:yes stop_codon:yes gene_type:complete